MKTRFLLFFLVFGIISYTMGQSTINLTFTAVNNEAYVQLDSIKIMNRTHGGDTVLYWPDTVLSINYVGIHENPSVENVFQVFRYYPNPVTEHTTISLNVPEKDKVNILVTDILGLVVVQSEQVLDKGEHSYLFTPGNENLYFFTARWGKNISSIKILNLSSRSNICFLEYIGGEPSTQKLKITEVIQEFTFSPGDELLFIGYSETIQSGMLDSPGESETYPFQYATNIPCPGTPSVTYEGQVYSTIQIFSQCWLKENLNVGNMIFSSLNQTNNGIKEKYCYDNKPDSCTKYGGLYQWDEMMQYTTQQGARGICPPGWHLPTDEEWKLLEGEVDSQYGISDPEWDIGWDWRGYDAGSNLKSTSGWNSGGNGNDLFGFSGLPGGFRYGTGTFADVGSGGLWFSSSEYDPYGTWERILKYSYLEVERQTYHKEHGYSVRCLRD